MEVLIPGASRAILARSGDSLTGGGLLRASFDQIYWFPDANDESGAFFINHEIVSPNGGVSRLRYDGTTITERRDWVTGTHFNSSGCITSWGVILSSEEHPPADQDSLGYLVEVDPAEPNTWVRRKAMGRFSHEGVIEHPVTGEFYMADDSYTGVFFKFVPFFPDYLGAGALFAYREGSRDWVLVTNVTQTESEAIALGATTYPRLEDLAYNPIDEAIYIMVTGRINDPDSQLGYILRYDPATMTMTRWLDGDGTFLANPDNVEVDSFGNLLVEEDQYPANKTLYGPNELLLVGLDRTIVPLLRGLDMLGEVTGLTLDASEGRFWTNWMNGMNGSELLQVKCPPGWNSPPVAVPEAPPPSVLRLELVAAPNPFAATIQLRSELGAEERVRLDIFDVRGVHWRTLIDRPHAGGLIVATWDGRDGGKRAAPAGAYFARLTAGRRTAASRVLLVR
jgi:hypothetical protein